MKNKKNKLLEAAIKKVGLFFEQDIIKEEAWTWNIFKKSFRYSDKENRIYRAYFKKDHILVVVLIPYSSKKHKLSENNMEFIVDGDNIYRNTDWELTIGFFSSFFKRRGYEVVFSEPKEKRLLPTRVKKLFMTDGQHLAELELIRTFPYWELTVNDAEESSPHFCTTGYKYKFHLKNSIKVDKEFEIENLLIEYEEDEAEKQPFFSISSIRKAVYGFNSPNLRAFYSNEGIFPEVQHSIKLTVFANLAVAIINASVFVRVAERLKGNTWYTLAAGILVFLRAPAEVFYVKKSLRLSKHLPSAIVKETMDSDAFKEFSETKEIRRWRNFEKVFYDIVRKKENFTFLMEQYGVFKESFNQALKENSKIIIIHTLRKHLNFTESELMTISPFIEQLEPIDVQNATKGLMKSFAILQEKDVFKPTSGVVLKKYAEEIFPIHLLNTTFSKTMRIVRDRIKQEERVPSLKEVSLLVSTCKKNILPFRVMDITLFSSLYAIGYASTFLTNLPNLFVPIYYILYGAAANIINAAVLRISNQVNMQYLYRNLGSAPAISSAADAWNEYNSHLMRIWAVFSSIGLIIGMCGKLFSESTYGISRYFVEIFAFFLFIKGFREWYYYYSSLETKIKLEEQK
jgi:hypothetical protein